MSNSLEKINVFSKSIPLASSFPVGAITAYFGSTDPAGWLICDGRNTTGTNKELSTHYPELYTLLGSNILPDLRECVLVGAGQRSSGVTTHDTYTLGQFKDDQVGIHTHCYWDAHGNETNALIGYNEGTQVDVNKALTSSPVQYSAWRWNIDHGWVYGELNGVSSFQTWDATSGTMSEHWEHHHTWNFAQTQGSIETVAGGSGNFKTGYTSTENLNHTHYIPKLYNDHRHIMPYVGSNTDGGNPNGRTRASGERNGNVTRTKQFGINFIIRAVLN